MKFAQSVLNEKNEMKLEQVFFCCFFFQHIHIIFWFCFVCLYFFFFFDRLNRYGQNDSANHGYKTAQSIGKFGSWAIIRADSIHLNQKRLFPKQTISMSMTRCFVG